MSIKLSFCIPTLNRAHLIGISLDSIIEQATDEVEVVIVDGASVDNTEDVIRGRQQRFPRIRYHRGERNMGVERDTQTSVELATGEYCWLMTSDDVLKPGAIAQVRTAMDQGHDLIVVNSEVRSPDLTTVLEDSKLQAKTDRIYLADDFEKLFIDTADYLSYMGGVVIRKAVWDSREKAAYLDTDFIHVGVIFQRALSGTALVLAKPLIGIRWGNATWTPRSFVIWGFHWPRLIWSFPMLTDAAKGRICRREGWSDLRRLILQRATGVFSAQEYQKHIQPLPGPWRAKWMAKLITLFPGKVLNLILQAYFSLRGGRGTILVALKQSHLSPFKVDS